MRRCAGPACAECHSVAAMGLGVGLSGRRPAVCSSGNGAGFRPQRRWEAARSATCLGSQLTVRATVPGGALSEAAPAAAQAGTVTAELAGSKHHHTTREQQQLLANIRGLGLSPSDEYPHQFLWSECRDVEERTIA